MASSNLEAVLAGIAEQCQAAGDRANEAAAAMAEVVEKKSEIETIEQDLQAAGTSIDEIRQKLRETRAEALSLGEAIDAALGADPMVSQRFDRWTDQGSMLPEDGEALND